MNYITFLFAYIGFVAVGICLFYLANQAIETWFGIRACKRDIERLERQIKNLQCNRLP